MLMREQFAWDWVNNLLNLYTLMSSLLTPTWVTEGRDATLQGFSLSRQ